MSLRLAVASEDFGPALRKAIPRAGQAQVDGIRINARRDVLGQNMSRSGLKQLAQYVRENRMQVAGLSCPTRHSLADEQYLEERIQLIRAAMDLARPLQTTHLLVPCGIIPDPGQDAADSEPDHSDIDQLANPFSFAVAGAAPKSPAEEFRLLCEVLTDLARHGNHVGCVLTLQLPHFDIKLTRQLLNEISTGPVQIVFDPAVSVFSGGQPVGVYRDLYDQVGYVRARDGIRNTDYSGTEMPVGDGVVDWDELLPTLIEADYTGWVCVERTGGDHREADVLRSVSRVKDLLPRPADAT